MTNIYDKIKTVRKPRVQISYDVEDNGALVKKELPFVVGVLGDFSGDSKNSLKALKHRKFVNINGENFEQVMASIAPSVKTKVENTLKDDGSQISVDLTFKSMDDFTPGKIAENIPVLKRLLDIRAKLNQLLTKIERSDELEEALSKLIQSEETLKEVIDHFNSQEQTDAGNAAEGDLEPDSGPTNTE